MIYIYVKKSVTLQEGEKIMIGDIAQIYDSAGGDVEPIAQKYLGRVGKRLRLFTCVDLYRALDNNDDKIRIIGADACAIRPEVEQSKGFVLFGKVLLICLILFAGAGLTIINYHSDVDMIGVHQTLARILTGEESFAKWISLFYSIGLALGVLFFANLIPGKKRSPSIFDIEQFEQDSKVESFERFKAEQDKN